MSTLRLRLPAIAPLLACGRGDDAEADPQRYVLHAAQDEMVAGLLVVLGHRLDHLAVPAADVDLTRYAIETDGTAATLAARLACRLIELPKPEALREPSTDYQSVSDAQGSVAVCSDINATVVMPDDPRARSVLGNVAEPIKSGVTR